MPVILTITYDQINKVQKNVTIHRNTKPTKIKLGMNRKSEQISNEYRD